MTDKQQPEALRLADALEEPLHDFPEPTTLEAEAAAELRRLHAYCQELESQVVLDCMTHVQNPAEIEHVAGVVSKNGAELNMGVAYAEPSEFPAGAIVNGRTHIDRLESFYRFDCEAGPLINCDDWHGLKRCFEHLAALRTQQPAPATQQAGDVVAYLDVGAGGYLDLGSELSEDALQQLPKGRHALVIAGTYGIDGYVAAPQPSPTTKPAPQQEAQEPTTVDKKTMELAESVGLIGPASRVGDLHAAIQRFHDLICVNATIKAAVMAAEAIGKQQAAPQQEAQEPVMIYHGDCTIDCGEHGHHNVELLRMIPAGSKLYTAPQPSPAAQGDALDAARYRFLRDGEWRDTDLEPFIRLQLNTLWDAKIDAARAAQEGKSHDN